MKNCQKAEKSCMPTPASRIDSVFQVTQQIKENRMNLGADVRT